MRCGGYCVSMSSIKVHKTVIPLPLLFPFIFSLSPSSSLSLSLFLSLSLPLPLSLSLSPPPSGSQSKDLLPRPVSSGWLSPRQIPSQQEEEGGSEWSRLWNPRQQHWGVLHDVSNHILTSLTRSSSKNSDFLSYTLSSTDDSLFVVLVRKIVVEHIKLFIMVLSFSVLPLAKPASHGAWTGNFTSGP